MIILEGPDGSGKTTLATYLKQFGYERVHTDKPKEGEAVFKSYQAALHQARGKAIVFDRLFHGEAVYGPLLRGMSKLTPWQLLYLELEAADALVVWCQAPAAKLVERGDPIYQKPWAPGPFTPEEQAQQLLDKYSYVRESSRLLGRSYDSSIDLPTDVSPPPLPDGLNVGRWVGGSGAKTVFVGERFPGAPHHTSPRWEKDLLHLRPFDGSRSGEYLMKALQQTSFRPRDLMLTNAIKDHLPQHQSREALIVETAGRKVVALGNDAESELKRAGVKVDEKVPHPQWWSRFRHDQLTQYAEVLRAAL